MDLRRDGLDLVGSMESRAPAVLVGTLSLSRGAGDASLAVLYKRSLGFDQIHRAAS